MVAGKLSLLPFYCKKKTCTIFCSLIFFSVRDCLNAKRYFRLGFRKLLSKCYKNSFICSFSCTCTKSMPCWWPRCATETRRTTGHLTVYHPDRDKTCKYPKLDEIYSIHYLLQVQQPLQRETWVLITALVVIKKGKAQDLQRNGVSHDILTPSAKREIIN